MDSSTEEVIVSELPAPEVAKSPSVLAVEPRCPKCTSQMLRCQIGHVSIYGWWLERVIEQAGALGPPRTATSDVEAHVCVQCGYTELYAKDPAAITSGSELH